MLAINHLVRSQERDWPGNPADRFDAMGAKRREVESLTGTAVCLGAPAEFLELLVDAVVGHSRPLAEEVTGMNDPHRRAVLEAFVEAVDTEGAGLHRLDRDQRLTHRGFRTVRAAGRVRGGRG